MYKFEYDTPEALGIPSAALKRSCGRMEREESSRIAAAIWRTRPRSSGPLSRRAGESARIARHIQRARVLRSA